MRESPQLGGPGSPQNCKTQEPSGAELLSGLHLYLRTRGFVVAECLYFVSPLQRFTASAAIPGGVLQLPQPGFNPTVSPTFCLHPGQTGNVRAGPIRKPPSSTSSTVSQQLRGCGQASRLCAPHRAPALALQHPCHGAGAPGALCEAGLGSSWGGLEAKPWGKQFQLSSFML